MLKFWIFLIFGVDSESSWITPTRLNPFRATLENGIKSNACPGPDILSRCVYNSKVIYTNFYEKISEKISVIFLTFF